MDTFVIWCAGFFDGEGSISIPHGKRKSGGFLTINQLWLQITVTQNQTPPLWAIRERFGGRLARAPQPAEKKITRPIWRWVADADKAAEFLRIVRPFLRVKGAPADVAMEFQAQIHHSKGAVDKQEILSQRLLLKARLEQINREPHAV